MLQGGATQQFSAVPLNLWTEAGSADYMDTGYFAHVAMEEARRFGNIPVVHQVGGLVKVVDGETGLAYQGNTRENLLSCLERAMALYGNHGDMRRMQRRAVRLIFEKYTWNVVMEQYLNLYQRARERRLRSFSAIM
jgi:glycogen synthase